MADRDRGGGDLSLRSPAARASRPAYERCAPIVVVAATDVGMIRSLHEVASVRGWLLVPAPQSSAALMLVERLDPVLVVAELLLPPRGGADFLAAVERAAPGSRRCLSAWAGWSLRNRNPPEAHRVVETPLAPDDIDRLFDEVGGERLAALPVLDEKEIEALGALAAARGLGGRPGIPESLAHRPEVELVMRFAWPGRQPS
jgi:hypothetical protein